MKKDRIEEDLKNKYLKYYKLSIHQKRELLILLRDIIDVAEKNDLKEYELSAKGSWNCLERDYEKAKCYFKDAININKLRLFNTCSHLNINTL